MHRLASNRSCGQDAGELIDKVQALSGQLEESESQIDGDDSKLLALQPMLDSPDSDLWFGSCAHCTKRLKYRSEVTLCSFIESVEEARYPI